MHDERNQDTARGGTEGASISLVCCQSSMALAASPGQVSLRLHPPAVAGQQSWHFSPALMQVAARCGCCWWLEGTATSLQRLQTLFNELLEQVWGLACHGMATKRAWLQPAGAPVGEEEVVIACMPVPKIWEQCLQTEDWWHKSSSAIPVVESLHTEPWGSTSSGNVVWQRGDGPRGHRGRSFEMTAMVTANCSFFRMLEAGLGQVPSWSWQKEDLCGVLSYPL